MIRTICIKNFRSLQRLEVKGLSRLTLVSGRNNVGKSTLLEALFLMMDHSSPECFKSLLGFRGANGFGTEFYWDPLFYDMQTDKTFEVNLSDESVDEKLAYRKDTDFLPYSVPGLPDDVLTDFRGASKSSYTLSFEYTRGDYKEKGHFSLNGAQVLRNIETTLEKNEIQQMTPTRYINNLFARDTDFLLNEISKIELRGEKDQIIQILKIIDDRIEDIVTLSVQGNTQLYIRMNGRLLPLQYAGDGIMKVLNICLAIEENPNGLVLIDEIETGLHYSAYADLCRIIEKISKKYNCQVIATTHSYEFIEGADEGVKDKDAFTYFRIGRSEKGVTEHKFDQEMLAHALRHDMEVR